MGCGVLIADREEKVLILSTGVTGGVAKWGYILEVTGVTKLVPEHTK